MIVAQHIGRLVRHRERMEISVEHWKEEVRKGDEILSAGGVEIVEVTGKIMPEDFKIMAHGELISP